MKNLQMLDSELRRNLRCWEDKLCLQGFLLFSPNTNAGDGFLDWMEEEGYLPPTVSWLNSHGYKMRFYVCAVDLGSFEMSSLMSIEIFNGPEPLVRFPSTDARLSAFQRCDGDPSMLETKPAELPEGTLDLLQFFSDMHYWALG